MAVRWYACFRLSLRGVRDLLAERGVDVSPSTILAWVHTFGPLGRMFWMESTTQSGVPGGSAPCGPQPSVTWPPYSWGSTKPDGTNPAACVDSS